MQDFGASITVLVTKRSRCCDHINEESFLQMTPSVGSQNKLLIAVFRLFCRPSNRVGITASPRDGMLDIPDDK